MSRPITSEDIDPGIYACPLCLKSPCKHSETAGDGYTHREVIGGRPVDFGLFDREDFEEPAKRPPQLGVCRICGTPKEASLDGVVLSCVNRRDKDHRAGAFP